MKDIGVDGLNSLSAKVPFGTKGTSIDEVLKSLKAMSQ